MNRWVLSLAVAAACIAFAGRAPAQEPAEAATAEDAAAESPAADGAPTAAPDGSYPRTIRRGDEVCLVYLSTEGRRLERCRPSSQAWSLGGRVEASLTPEQLAAEQAVRARGRVVGYGMAATGGAVAVTGLVLALVPVRCAVTYDLMRDFGCYIDGQLRQDLGKVMGGVGAGLGLLGLGLVWAWDVDDLGVHATVTGPAQAGPRAAGPQPTARGPFSG